MQSETAMVPDDIVGQNDDDAALLETPAEINVIASGVIFRIETADILPSAKRHVTARCVRRPPQQNVTRLAGRGRDTRLNPGLPGAKHSVPLRSKSPPVRPIK